MTAAKTFALLGHPVGHSVSPAIHQAVYDQFGFDHRYVVFDCEDDAAVRAQRDALAAGRLNGVNITTPWKHAALALADELDTTAQETGAANTWRRDAAGRVVAHNTDAGALAELLTAGARRAHLARGQQAPTQFTATVLGNGGAALAAVVACRKAGAERIFVSARKWRGEAAAWPRRRGFEALNAELVAWSDGVATTPGCVAHAARQSQVVVQASSAGMLGVGNGESVCEVLPWQELDAGVFLYDVVYNPVSTPFLERARAHDLCCEGGLSMLVVQAALAVQLWLGVEADRERMQRAAARAIFGDDE